VEGVAFRRLRPCLVVTKTQKKFAQYPSHRILKKRKKSR
jgi:hypothetical protein